MKMIGRCTALAFLSAIVAEFLLGDQWLSGPSIDPGRQIAELLLYAAFYGSAAVLIRELARRTGHGWPSILLLGLAFALIEEGIVDESLFNPDFAGRHLLAFGFIPSLGIGGPWTIFVLSLHVIWSIGAPVAIAEALFPETLFGRVPVARQTQAPWLRVPAVVVLLFLLAGSGLAIFEATAGAHFLATPAQLIASAAGAAMLIIVTLALPRRAAQGRRPFGIAAVIGATTTSVYVALERLGGGLSPWIVSALSLLILAIGVLLARRLRLDVLGLAAGAVLTYSWLGLTRAVPLGIGQTIEQSLIVSVVIAAVAGAVHRRAWAAAGDPNAQTDHMHWTVIIPVKPAAIGKSRLGLGPEVARAIALDTIAAVVACEAVGRVIVVTADASFRPPGAEVLPEVAPAGIDAAVAAGAALAGIRAPRAALLGDLPALSPDDLATALAAASDAGPQHPRAFVPDHESTGTTLVTALPGVELLTAFGPASAAKHRALGLLELALPADSSVRFDVDTPEQLDAALAALRGRGSGVSKPVGDPGVSDGSSSPAPARPPRSPR